MTAMLGSQIIASLTVALPVGPEFPGLLREIREAQGLSQRQVAVKAAARGAGKLSAAYLSRLEAGERQLGVGAMAGISAVLPIDFSIEDGAVRYIIPASHAPMGEP